MRLQMSEHHTIASAQQLHLECAATHPAPLEVRSNSIRSAQLLRPVPTRPLGPTSHAATACQRSPPRSCLPIDATVFALDWRGLNSRHLRKLICVSARSIQAGAEHAVLIFARPPLVLREGPVACDYLSTRGHRLGP